MARKIGDIIIACIILFGVISALSLFITSADRTTGVNSGMREDLANLETEAKDANALEVGFTDKTDLTGTFVVDENIDLEDRGSDAAGEANIKSKNILTRFFSTMQEKLNIPPLITTIWLSMIGVVISILLLRVILGETRI